MGAFWEPSTPEIVYTGTLTANDDGITFTTAPKYDRQIGADTITHIFSGSNGNLVRLPILHGITEDGPTALCQLTKTDAPHLNFGHGYSLTTSSFRANLCVNGMHFGGLQEASIGSARYTFSGINEWILIPTNEEWCENQIVITIPLAAKDLVTFCITKNHTLVRLGLFAELTSGDAAARLVRPIPYVEVQPSEPKCLSWYIDVGNRLENLFSLLSGASVALETMFIYRDDQSGNVIMNRGHYESGFDPFECVRCTFSQIAHSIAVWLSESDAFRSVENVVLGVVRRRKLFVETEFLSLAQALEGLHRVTTTNRADLAARGALRKLRNQIASLLQAEQVDLNLSDRICTSLSHALDPTFSSRLSELTSLISPPLRSRMDIDPDQFVGTVVATRNFYTHVGSARDRRKGVLTGADLFLINQKMRALVRGALLLYLGIPEGQFSELLVRQATRWR